MFQVGAAFRAGFPGWGVPCQRRKRHCLRARPPSLYEPVTPRPKVETIAGEMSRPTHGTATSPRNRERSAAPPQPRPAALRSPLHRCYPARSSHVPLDAAHLRTSHQSTRRQPASSASSDSPTIRRGAGRSSKPPGAKNFVGRRLPKFSGGIRMPRLSDRCASGEGVCSSTGAKRPVRAAPASPLSHPIPKSA